MRTLLYFVAVVHCAVSTYTRCEIRTLTENALADLWVRFDALKASGAYDRLTLLHKDVFELVHHTPLFLPFHRYVVWEMENLMRGVRPGGFAMPYYNSTLDTETFEDSPVWKVMGPLRSGCVQHGPLAKWKLAGDPTSCVHREPKEATRISNWSTWANIMSTGNDTTFGTTIELGPHTAIHKKIGGCMGTPASPDDPIFYLHHAFVDLAWTVRQHNLGTETDLDLDQLLPLTNYTVADVIHLEYSYV